jgi:DNA-binding response OmpR family regulator
MRLLLVEDDARIASAVATYLRREGFAIDAVGTGEEAVQLAGMHDYDAAILDIGLPGMDGTEVCRQLRARTNPVRIIMATARDSVADRINGLNLGADDYLLKPYALGELLARLRAVLRRPAAADPVTLLVGDLALDTGTRQATRNNRIITLTAKEFAVLEFLMRNVGRVITRDKLSAHAWDNSYDAASNVIDVYVARLRRKIDTAGETPLLSTIRGAGYRLGPVTTRTRSQS